MYAAVAAIAITACGGRKAQPDGEPSRRDDAAAPRMHVVPTPGTGTARPAIDTPAIPLPRELSFTLLSPGDAPRARLRYEPGGAPRELVARSTVTTRASVDGTWSDEVTQAPVRDGFGVTAVAGVVELRGLDARVDAGSPAGVAAAERYVTRWRALLAKRRADVAIDARGRLERATLLDDPAGTHVDAREELVQRWLALAVPLPEEAVGVGARWRVVTALRAGGVVLKQTATYRLAAADDTAWTIELEAERIGEPQDIAVPGKPGASLGELLGMRRVVTGTVVVGRADPLPLRGSLAAEVSSHARVTAGGRTTEQFSEDRGTIELGPP